MKQTTSLSRWPADVTHWSTFNAAALLSWCLFCVAGCSASGSGAAADGGVPLGESDVAAIKAKAKSNEEYKDLIKKDLRQRAGMVSPNHAVKEAPKGRR